MSYVENKNQDIAFIYLVLGLQLYCLKLPDVVCYWNFNMGHLG